MSGAPVLVVVSGALGAGKTTLSRQLTGPLGATMLSKDRMKESMYEPLDLTTDERSLQGSVAAMRLLYDLAATSGSPLVVEANWKPLDVPQLQALGRPTVQLFCDAPSAVLQQRVRARVRTGERHPVHRDRFVPALLEKVVSSLARPRRPLDLGCPTLAVDTSVPVDVPAVIGWVRSQVPP